MILRSHAKDPKQLMMMGMALLVPALVWPRFVPVTGHVGSDAIDGIRGVLIGMSIALNLWSARLVGRRRRGGGDR
jgi:hypothetical protein